MKRKVIRSLIWIVIIISSQSNPIGFATEAPDFNYQLTSPVMSSLKQQTGAEELYGEIISITPTDLTLRIHHAQYHFPISPRAYIFCNGQSAIWKSLTPVTDESFFEAKMLLNKNSEVIAVDGHYYGESCVIKEWICREGQLTRLKILAPEFGISAWKTVASREVQTGSFPPDLSWLEVDREIFVLYNFKGEIRAIFLPEDF